MGSPRAFRDYGESHGMGGRHLRCSDYRSLARMATGDDWMDGHPSDARRRRRRGRRSNDSCVCVCVYKLIGNVRAGWSGR